MLTEVDLDEYKRLITSAEIIKMDYDPLLANLLQITVRAPEDKRIKAAVHEEISLAHRLLTDKGLMMPAFTIFFTTAGLEAG